MSIVSDRISATGLMPVVGKLTSFEQCDHLAGALMAGGVPAMEITFRMEKAEEYIRYIREHYPQILVGAGTVLTTQQAQKAIDAGAQFLVAPGFNPRTVAYAQEKGIDIFPGVSSPSEIEQAIEMGLSVLKFFPAEASGGTAALKAFSGPYKKIKFMPTGGVGLQNIAEYYALEQVCCVGGSFMLGSHLTNGEWGEIARICRRTIKIMLGLKLAHVGVNTQDADAAQKTASLFGDLLLLDVLPGNSSIFADTMIEVMKTNYLGSNGHLGFSTPCIERAVRYFKGNGVCFREDTAKYSSDGKLSAIYFADEIGGFAIHLVQAK